jgi:hypothetical protein
MPQIRAFSKSSTLGTLQQRYHHHQRLHLSQIPLPRGTPNNSGWLGEKMPLPRIRKGVKKWLRAKGLFPSQSSQASFPGMQQPVSAPVVISQSGSTDPSRKLSDLFNGCKESELMTRWEDMSRTPTTANENAIDDGLFIGVDGKPSRRPHISWPAPPEDVSTSCELTELYRKLTISR